MARIMSANVCGVYSALEPLEELSIFYMLHTKFADIGKYQFSCSATHPLVKGSQWCHDCAKCYRNYVFSLAIGIDPASIGFKQDMTLKTNLDHNMDADEVLDYDMTLASYILQKAHPEIYRRLPEKGAADISKEQLLKHFFSLRPHSNLPPAYATKMIRIYDRHLEDFKKTIMKYI